MKAFVIFYFLTHLSVFSFDDDFRSWIVQYAIDPEESLDFKPSTLQVVREGDICIFPNGEVSIFLAKNSEYFICLDEEGCFFDDVEILRKCDFFSWGNFSLAKLNKLKIAVARTSRELSKSYIGSNNSFEIQFLNWGGVPLEHTYFTANCSCVSFRGVSTPEMNPWELLNVVYSVDISPLQKESKVLYNIFNTFKDGSGNHQSIRMLKPMSLCNPVVLEEPFAYVSCSDGYMSGVIKFVVNEGLELGVIESTDNWYYKIVNNHDDSYSLTIISPEVSGNSDIKGYVNIEVHDRSMRYNKRISIIDNVINEKQ